MKKADFEKDKSIFKGFRLCRSVPLKRKNQREPLLRSDFGKSLLRNEKFPIENNLEKEEIII